MKTSKRIYTVEFREAAVRMVLQQHVSVPEVARRLEMPDKTLARWVLDARNGSQRRVSVGLGERKSPSVSELQMEVSKLRAENSRLKMEREILKKATAFFVGESQ